MEERGDNEGRRRQWRKEEIMEEGIDNGRRRQ